MTNHKKYLKVGKSGCGFVCVLDKIMFKNKRFDTKILMSKPMQILNKNDALLLVDIQNDFLPGGSLAIPAADRILPIVNQYLRIFSKHNRLVIATRDWHPENHCSFEQFGGIWPPHCVAGSYGAAFPSTLELPPNLQIVSKASAQNQDAYSGFEDSNLKNNLLEKNIKRLFVCGLATDYCVLNTVVDGIKNGFETVVLVDAIRPVNLHPGDGTKAQQSMLSHGAKFCTLKDFSVEPANV